MAFWDFYTDLGGSIGGVLYSLLYIIPIVLILVVGFLKMRSMMVYKYPVRIFRIRENGKVKELNTRGGYVGRQNSAHFFRIKTGRWWWQCVDLTKTPNPAFLDEEDRVYYKQIDIDTYIQMHRKFTEDEKVTYTPVEADVKYGAILAIQRIKDVLRVEPAWKKVLPYAGLAIMAVVFIVAYAMLMERCSG